MLRLAQGREQTGRGSAQVEQPARLGTRRNQRYQIHRPQWWRREDRMSDLRRISGYEGWESWNYCGFCGGPLISDAQVYAYNRTTGRMLPSKRCDNYKMTPF